MTVPFNIEKLPGLDTIAAHLEGLEETIISKLIERAQFAQNLVVYEQGLSGFEGAGDISLFELRLRRVEQMDAEFGRFCSPEERPYFRDLPPSRRKTPPVPGFLAIEDYDSINMSEEIVAAYQSLIPEICDPGDDGHYGSSTEHDVFAVQAIGRRVHFGALYVAESKYVSDRATYDARIDACDSAGLERLLTRPEVEKRILLRVAQKVEHLQSQINPNVRRRISAQAVLNFYRTHVIPLTKRGETAYLLNRRRKGRQ